MIAQLIGRRVLVILLALGLLLIAIFQSGFYLPTAAPLPEDASLTASQDVKALSTKPENLENSVILPTQQIDVSFNTPIENTGEFKHKIEPNVNHTLKLSADRKTISILPEPSFQVGFSYTLFIQADTKFDGGKRLNDAIQYHFRTIEYKGI